METQSPWIQFLILDKPYDDMLNMGDRLVSQERMRLRDRLSDDRNAQDLFKGFLAKKHRTNSRHLKM